MSTVSGSVRVEETGFAIPGLLVSLFDVDERQPGDGDLPHGDRLGSVLTGEDGRFELNYELASAAVSRPNIVIVVSAPERPNEKSGTTVLHRSQHARARAGQ